MKAITTATVATITEDRIGPGPFTLLLPPALPETVT